MRMTRGYAGPRTRQSPTNLPKTTANYSIHCLSMTKKGALSIIWQPVGLRGPNQISASSINLFLLALSNDAALWDYAVVVEGVSYHAALECPSLVAGFWMYGQCHGNSPDSAFVSKLLLSPNWDPVLRYTCRMQYTCNNLP